MPTRDDGGGAAVANVTNVWLLKIAVGVAIQAMRAMEGALAARHRTARHGTAREIDDSRRLANLKSYGVVCLQSQSHVTTR